jgi:FkbM family methyltransferase
MKAAAKKIIKKLFETVGFFIIRADDHIGSTMKGALRAIAGRQHDINTVIDIGASDGQWSALLMAHYPLCNYLLIEAQPVHEPELRQFCAGHKNADFVLAAAGEKEGQIYFNTSDPFGGQASVTPYPENNISVPVITVDSAIEAKKLKGPYLLKLDTHGFELPIFNGAEAVLAETEVIIVECYNFKIAPECLRFHEICNFLEQKNFRCIDMVDVMRRPYDNALWQMDLVFIRNDRKEFQYADYQ